MSHPGGFILPPDPEEYKRQQEEAARQQEQAELQAHADHLAWIRFMGELNSEQAMILRNMFHSATQQPGMAVFYVGYLNALLTHKHGICHNCGENHDAILHDMVAEGGDDVQSSTS